MLIFTFLPIVIAAAALVLGEVFDISFLMPKYSHEGALSWTPEDMFPPRTLEDRLWEEMIKEAVRLQLENRPRPDRGTATMPDLDWLFGLVEGTF